MTLFAGAVSLRPGQPLPADLWRTLTQQLSRNPQDVPRLFSGEGHALVHLNLGVLEGESALATDDGRITLLAGEPLAGRSDETREADLARLHADAARGDTTTLRAARGTFCTAHVDTATRRVRLAADKLALRPLFYAIDDGVLLFATTMRLMLALRPHLGDRGDLAAQAQHAALGHPLGARTPYEAIRVVEGGQHVDIDAGGAVRHEHFRWDDVAPVDATADEFGERLLAAFTDAVRLRLGRERRVTAHISGGLDSRCVVAVLRELGSEVHSINFAPADSADLVLGRMAAERLGTHHFEYSQGGTDFWLRMIEAHAAWRRSAVPGAWPERPDRVWTGFAGETVLAPTNLTAQILQETRTQPLDMAVPSYLHRAGGELSHRLFVRARRQQMSTALRESVQAELSRRSSADPARRMHIYQLLNEPRGNLARHHEDLDLRRIEFTVPFCDTEVLSVALSWQLDPLLQHRFYYQWLERLPSGVREVPWQAYPWSLPCPLPMPERPLRYQWSEDWIHEKERKAELRRLVEQCSADLDHPHFPHHLLNRRSLRLACLLTQWGVARYAYLLRHALVFSRFAIRATAR
jgi:asparagine synthase (glutamine-hydrolysing)